MEVDAWPSRVRHLSLDFDFSALPTALFAGSADTLTSLKLAINTDDQRHSLAALAPHLTRVRTLQLRDQVGLDSDALALQTATFVAALSSLVHLRLGSIEPLHLRRLLSNLPPHPTLRTLTTIVEKRDVLRLSRPRPRPLIGPHLPQSDDLWGLRLRRCARTPIVQQLKVWQLGVEQWFSASWVQSPKQFSKGALEAEGRVPADWHGWQEFRAEVAEAGVKLVLGPLRGFD